ncbi:MAG: hypothetical protein DMF61_16340 [Blastocatellia bacterium AA13]|nr:MAG: hypothetical protein DMF61_16340 [Blastocatellia bacterium AA13]
MATLDKLIGETLDGKYLLDRLLGQGGMGAVFLATHIGTKRIVALKVIAPQFTANEEVGERFRREAEAAGRMRHPNVVNVTDFGFALMGRDRIAYLVMEYLDGCSLDDKLKETGSLPLAFTVDIVEQICLAISHAHKQGVIHRDLKPDNIWLQPDQRGGYIVKVLDFGLAKLRDTTADQGDQAESRLSTGAETQALARSVRTVAGRQTTNTRQAGSNTVAPENGSSSTVEAEALTTIQSPADHEEQKTAILHPADVTGIAPGETRAGNDSGARQNAADQQTDGITLIQNPTNDDEGVTRIQAGPLDEGSAQGSSTAVGARDNTQGAGNSTASQSNSHRSGATTFDSDTVKLTRIGSVLGTPLYMSPEQCRGEALDARSDIYSLGVIVYQMLAGEPPFKGNMIELMEKHMSEPPPRINEKRPDLPIAVANLIMAAIAKNPEQRPANSESFSAALRATAEGETEILRQSKAYYYTSQRVFFGLSALVYLPFAVLSMVLSIVLPKFVPLTTVASVAIFYVFIFLLVLFGTKICTAACALAIKELRGNPEAAIKPGRIFRIVAARSPAIVGTAAAYYLSVLAGLIRFITPAITAAVDGTLFPQIVVLEKRSGPDAIARSKQLISRLRPIAAALLAREFGISLGSIVFFPFISVGLAILFGGSGADSLNAMISPMMRHFLVFYCWFILCIMHTPYDAMPFASLYFKSRQAQGEPDDESGSAAGRRYDHPSRKPATISKTSLAWFTIPLLMLAFLIVFPATAGRTSLIESVRQGKQNSVQRMLAAGKSPNVTRAGGTSALMYASRDGYVDIAKLLIDAGANVNARDGDGDDALMYAALDGRSEVISLLLSNGANLNGKNNHSETALLAAARRGRTETVRRLLAAGPDVTVKNDKGKTALECAEEEGHLQVADLLKQVGEK